jgi:ribonuclease Z
MSDLEKLPDLKDFSVIVHFTNLELLCQAGYLDHFPESCLNLCFLNDEANCAKSMWQFYQSHSTANSRLFPPLAWENPVSPDLKHFVPLRSGDSVNFDKFAVNRSPSESHATVCPEFPTVTSFRVTFLGTMAGFSYADRTTSSILVQTPGQFLLLDCGKGCLSQIRRQYGRANTAAILRQLRCIWISHCHADHTCGLIRLLSERTKVTEETVIVACCGSVSEELAGIEGAIGSLHIQFVSRDTPFSIGETVVESCPVVHCEGSMGCVLTFQGGLRLAYTGDQFPDGSFARNVGTCNVLIHEGTYDSAWIDTARAHGHSTVGQALEMAARMQPQFVVLTHLSVRVHLELMALEPANALCAFDHFTAAYEDMAESIRVAKEVLRSMMKV